MEHIISTGYGGRRQTTIHKQAMDGDVTVATTQDVTKIVEENKHHYNSFTEGARSRWGVKGAKESFYRVAQIPMTLMMRLIREGIADDPKAWERWLNDSDNRLFRTRPGRVAVNHMNK